MNENKSKKLHLRAKLKNKEKFKEASDNNKIQNVSCFQDIKDSIKEPNNIFSAKREVIVVRKKNSPGYYKVITPTGFRFYFNYYQKTLTVKNKTMRFYKDSQAKLLNQLLHHRTNSLIINLKIEEMIKELKITDIKKHKIRGFYYWAYAINERAKKDLSIKEDILIATDHDIKVNTNIFPFMEKNKEIIDKHLIDSHKEPDKSKLLPFFQTLRK